MFDKILRIKSSGSFWNLSANTSDHLTVMLGFWDCPADLDLLIVVNIRVQTFMEWSGGRGFGDENPNLLLQRVLSSTSFNSRIRYSRASLEADTLRDRAPTSTTAHNCIRVRDQPPLPSACWHIHNDRGGGEVGEGNHRA
ncbi:hypothetical protein OIU84_023506 [Salix udensis]|uniref:Uncharacterized protein n=1 Tax=Salix udensis TaxID=889485 RepID=A0AAD6PH08_9ROSI|nr:hypothetical protein OIU84_023506 [Salix udensis]